MNTEELYMHQHEHHHDDHHHDHEHGHAHTHDHGSSTAHHHGGNDHETTDGHENLLKSKEEVAAFLQYTLHHNAHHEEELDGLAHSLEHLQLTKEAQEIRLAIQDYDQANMRLEVILAALK